MFFAVAGGCFLVLFLILSELARAGNEEAFVVANLESWFLMLLGLIGIGMSYLFAYVGRTCDGCVPEETFWSGNHPIFIGAAFLGTVALIVATVMIGFKHFRVASAWMLVAAAIWGVWMALVWPFIT
jgi:hypothetical protein